MILAFAGKSIIRIDEIRTITPVIENDERIERYRLKFNDDQVIGIDKKTMKKLRKVIKRNLPINKRLF